MIILKVGGGSSINMSEVASDLTKISEPVIVVLGANSLRDRTGEKLNIKKQVVTSVKGYTSVMSDSDLIDLQMMVYSGVQSQRFVELCQMNGINAVSLSGLDGAVIRGRRNRGVRVKEEGKIRILRDFSGKPVSINTELLDYLISKSYLPVLTVPILDETGCALNSENDDIAALLNSLYGADEIIHLIEAPGLLKDHEDEGSLVTSLTFKELCGWEEISEGRIRRKLLSIRKLMAGHKTRVRIADGRCSEPVTNALKGGGTVIE